MAAGVSLRNRDLARTLAEPINDVMTKNGKLRIDGRVERELYLYEVKRPEESRYPWDYLKLVQTIPAAMATRPLGEGGCPLVKSANAH